MSAEHRPRIDSARLDRCFNPHSIAVIGGGEAARVIQQCRKLGFDGALHAVNPKRDSMEGLRCYGDIDALPSPPDAAFIAVPAEASIELVARLSRRGAGGAVCYASGFKEIGARSAHEDGEARQRRLIAAAGAMPVIGPNCYGFLNLLSGAALWPDYHGAARTRRGVAIFSQSGNVSLNLSMQQRRLPLAWLASVGNQAVVGVEDCIAAALARARADGSITAIGLHIEGLNDLPRFAQLAAQARAQGIPMVALKVGRSAIGARITRSHTATLAGESAWYDALFERLGIGCARTPETFIETLKLLAFGGALRGNRIASLSCSGGEAALVADLSAARGIDFPPLEDAHRDAVQATLNDYVRVDNPLDYHTFIWGDRARMRDTFAAMMAGAFDLTLLILDTPADDDESAAIWLRAAHAFVDACADSGGRGAVAASLSECMPDAVARVLCDHGIAPLQGLAQALDAVDAACAIGRAWSCADAPPRITACAAAARDALRQLDEHDAKQRLSAAGLRVPSALVAASADDAVAAAAQLQSRSGGAVALKALSSAIAHKTEAGAVALDLRDGAQVRAQATRMLALAEVDRVLVEAMVVGGVAEMLLSVGYNRAFGHGLLLGCGGAEVELIGDRQLLLLPTDEAMLRRALARLRTAPLLHGYRGRPHADVDAVIACAMRLSEMVARDADIVEIEINPLIVKAQGEGAAVADAVMTVRQLDHE